MPCTFAMHSMRNPHHTLLPTLDTMYICIQTHCLPSLYTMYCTLPCLTLERRGLWEHTGGVVLMHTLLYTIYASCILPLCHVCLYMPAWHASAYLFREWRWRGMGDAWSLALPSLPPYVLPSPLYCMPLLPYVLVNLQTLLYFMPALYAVEPAHACTWRDLCVLFT